MIKKISIFIFLSITSLHWMSCNTMVAFQKKNLYDQQEVSGVNEIEGFKAIDIFVDEIDKSVWVSPETQCITLKKEEKEVFSKNGSLHLKWDKVSGGCKWIGMGFGWNNWVPKDMQDIVNVAAVQFQVKSAKGTFTNLPVAFAFEDYSGVQSYYGFNNTLVSQAFNENTWTAVTIPLSKFNFENNDFSIDNVKQFMIQFEGDGDIYLDEIKFINLNK